jgi:hypothetical protein
MKLEKVVTVLQLRKVSLVSADKFTRTELELA